MFVLYMVSGHLIVRSRAPGARESEQPLPLLEVASERRSVLEAVRRQQAERTVHKVARA